jgi:hypothetical protein
MPLVLLAGTVKSLQSFPFPPGDERPRCECVILADNTLFRVVGYDETMTLLESLVPGDACSIQGALMIETRRGQLSGLFVIAAQVMPLRKRSPNRSMVAAA